VTTPKDKKAQPKINVIDRRHWAVKDSAEAGGAATTTKKPSYVEELEGKLRSRDAKLDDTLTKHRAAVQEFDEARTRLQREVSVEVERQKRTILVELLEVVDNLDRAVDAADAASSAATLKQGVEMVRSQFLSKLAGFGVSRRASLNESFDPKWHDAVTNMPVEDAAQDGIVLGVIQEGYAINGEPLRPARVAVGRKTPAEA
jgi:molecular chaperone GrpE